MRIGMVLVLLLALLPFSFGDTLSAKAQRTLAPTLKMALRKPPALLKEHSQTRRPLMNVKTVDDKAIFGVFVRTSLQRDELEELAGVKVRGPYGNIYTADVERIALLRLAEHSQILSISPGFKLQPLLNVSTAASTLGGDYLGCNAKISQSYGLQGQGVVVGAVDTGIDWTHGDFIRDPDSSNQSRILHIWDQNDNTGPNPPGYPYGTEYSQAEINSALVSGTGVAHIDLEGHGTHVMGIAAGDGSESDGAPPAGTYRGVAPRADIVMVATSGYSDEVADGVAYIFEKASSLSKCAVVNLSLGSHLGPHDGTSEFSQALDALTGPGRIVVASAGNEGNDNIHAEASVAPAGFVDIQFDVDFDVLIMGMDLWYQGGDSFTLQITNPAAQSFSVGPGGSGSTTLADGSEIEIDNSVLSHPNNGDGEIAVAITPATGGTWSLRMTRSATGANGDFDAWIYAALGLFGGRAQFLDHVDSGETVIMPSVAEQVVSVAAHTTKIEWTTCDGPTAAFAGTLAEIAEFSSHGPTRDTSSLPGRQKPDLSAPGHTVVSSLSEEAEPFFPAEAIADDCRHNANSGTSMSAPHVAGAVALMLEQKPYMAVDEILALLKDGAFTDSFTGGVHNYTYGWGKLNVNGSLPIPLPLRADYWHLYH